MDSNRLFSIERIIGQVRVVNESPAHHAMCVFVCRVSTRAAENCSPIAQALELEVCIKSIGSARAGTMQ